MDNMKDDADDEYDGVHFLSCFIFLLQWIAGLKVGNGQLTLKKFWATSQ